MEQIMFFFSNVTFEEAEAESVRLNREAGWNVSDRNEEIPNV